MKQGTLHAGYEYAELSLQTVEELTGIEGGGWVGGGGEMGVGVGGQY